MGCINPVVPTILGKICDKNEVDRKAIKESATKRFEVSFHPRYKFRQDFFSNSGGRKPSIHSVHGFVKSKTITPLDSHAIS